MTRIDFYILKNSAQANHYHFACQLAEKIYKSGHQLLINTDSEPAARHLDDMLWTFRDRGFIPHAIYQQQGMQSEPVLISCTPEPDTHSDVLLNLADEVPGFFSRFQRVAEIVSQEAQQKQAARVRYKFYRDRGYQIVTHEI